MNPQHHWRPRCLVFYTTPWRSTPGPRQLLEHQSAHLTEGGRDHAQSLSERKLYPARHSLHIPLHKCHSDSRQAIIQGRWGFSQSHFWKSHNLKSHSVPGKPRQLVTWWHDYIPRQERLEEYVSCWTKNSVKMGFVPKKGRRNGQASNIWKCDRHEEATSHAFCNSQWSRFWGISIPEMIKKRRPLRRLKRGI